MHNTEALENKEHPLERIMDIHNEEDHTLVTTTGLHLARSYQGELSLQYGEDEEQVHVHWKR